MNRAANALHVLIICQSILRRMFTTRRHAEMRDGGGESSTIDNDIRPIYLCDRILSIHELRMVWIGREFAYKNNKMKEKFSKGKTEK